MLAAVRSDVGKVREVNEDYTFISKPYPNGLMVAIVADGMGGHLAGEIASKTAVEIIYQALDQIISQNLTMEQYQEVLEQAILNANNEVYNQSMNNDGFKGMGTTIVASIVSPKWVLLGHIGDSRAYMIDNDNIQQLTVDHSLVNELLKNGQISLDEAVNHPKRNILTRALGTDQQVEVDINLVNWKEGSTLILCSDGLTNLVSDEKMFELVHNNSSVEDIVDRLIEMANEAGGDDNISVVIIHH